MTAKFNPFDVLIGQVTGAVRGSKQFSKSSSGVCRKHNPRSVMRLVTRKSLKSGAAKVASSSDGVVDYAVGVHQGVIPNAGLPSLIYMMEQGRAAKLSVANTVRKTRLKAATSQGNHRTTELKRLADEALPTILSPSYWTANRHLGVRVVLNPRYAAKWFSAEVAKEDSVVCDALRFSSYQDLVGQKRGWRWWLDRLKIRKYAE